MADLSSAFGDAFAILVRIGGGALIWLAARSLAREYKPIATASAVGAYSRVAFGCAVLALVLWANYGTHTEDSDPLFGGGEEVVDFEPTPGERNKHGVVVFIVALTLAAHGTWYGRNNPR